MPVELHNRTREIWRPLWVIADLAGGEWPARSRSAAVALHTAQSHELDHRVLLLADIRGIFEAAKADRMHTKDLLQDLVEIEEHPWRGWWMDSYAGTPKTDAAYRVAKILKEYGIEPETNAFAVGSVRARGYAKAAFESAWKQYLPAVPPVPSVSSVQPEAHNQADCTENTPGTERRRLPTVPTTATRTKAADQRSQYPPPRGRAGSHGPMGLHRSSAHKITPLLHEKNTRGRWH
jgi:hypothetical protein